MAQYNANILIRELRKAQNMTQDQLAEGICSRHTITKIESGERKADWFILQNVLLRLGVVMDEPQNFTSEMLSGDEVHVVQKHSECQQTFDSFDNEKLNSLLLEMENDKRYAKGSTGRGYQVYLRYKAALHLQGAYKNIELCLQFANECVKLNRPDFDITKIPQYFLSQDELILINMMAIATVEVEGIDRAIEIWLMMKANYEKQYHVRVHENPRYRGLVVNICVALKNAQRIEECLELAEEGLKSTLTNNEMKSHMIYYRLIVWCLMKLGREEEGKERYKKFLMLAYVMDGYSSISFELAKKEYENDFGGKLDLSLEW